MAFPRGVSRGAGGSSPLRSAHPARRQALKPSRRCERCAAGFLCRQVPPAGGFPRGCARGAVQRPGRVLPGRAGARSAGAAPAAAALWRPLSAARRAARTLLPARRRRSPPAPRVSSPLLGKGGDREGVSPGGAPRTPHAESGVTPEGRGSASPGRAFAARWRAGGQCPGKLRINTFN